MEKIGVFGGTFDPIHFGHIDLGKQAISECGLSRLIVMPAKIQPFKIGLASADAAHRLEMARIAFEEEGRVTVSDLELKSESVSYTVFTLRAIKKQFPDAKVAFVIGTDAFLKVEIWREAPELLAEYSFIVGTRPGYKAAEIEACVQRLRENYHTDIQAVGNRQIPVSSTEIKQKLRAGESCSGLIPEAVERYIIANGLYKELY